MNETQDYIPISDVADDIVLLKDGGAVVVLKTTAVNFGLLSGEEQMAIIGSFAQMLNSLSFGIQIVIRSKRLDISSYLQLLDRALQLQTNPLLAQMMIRYRNFIQSLIKENEVLDKSFFVVIPLSGLEMGLGLKNKADRLKKAFTILNPRRDQIIRQLARVGLSADSLKKGGLVKLFYDIYNPISQTPAAQVPQVNLQPQAIAPSQRQHQATTSASQPPQTPVHPTATPPPPVTQTVTAPTIRPATSRNHPFVVEELADSI